MSDANSVSDIRADRLLILPGPIPPLTHLGATMLRHSLHSGMRYALYQLGLPAPESPPTRFVSLRLYFDGPAVTKLTDGTPDASEIVSAILDPGGEAQEPLTRRSRGISFFHRQRLRFARGPSSERSGPPVSVASLRAELSRLLPVLGDALLGEILAALARRRDRAAGRTLAPAQSAQALRYLTGKRADHRALGAPDPYLPSWHDPSERPEADPAVLGSLSRPRYENRGLFRERYRRVLDFLRPQLLAVAEAACDRGHLDRPDDIFFLPFDLLEDLEAEVRPSWLKEAIDSNRAEWLECSSRPPPADTLGNVEPKPRGNLDTELAPLALLP